MQAIKVKEFFNGASLFRFLFKSRDQKKRELLNDTLVSHLIHTAYLYGLDHVRLLIPPKDISEIIQFINNNE
jgi:hypothetical protein